MNRSKSPPQDTKLTNIDITPVVFDAASPVGSVIATVLVETSGEPFRGTLALSGPDQEKFAVTDGLLFVVADVPPGNYEITVIAESGTESLYSPQVLTAVGSDNVPEPGPEPEPEPPPASNADNTMTLTNVSEQAVVDYPLQFGRAFVEGEIPNYAEIVIDGGLVPTQCDVKNRWPDGSVKFAIMAAVVPLLPPDVPTTVQFANITTGNNAPSDPPPDYDARINLTNPVSGATAFASAKEMLQTGRYS